MGLEWIKITCDLPDKWQVLAVRRALKVRTAYEIVGMLVKLWAHFENHTTNGKLPGLEADDVDRLVGKKGFAAALVAVGWLKTPAGGGVEIPAFDEFMGAASRKREENAERQRRHRDEGVTTVTEPRDAARDGGVTVARQACDTSVTAALPVRDESVTQEIEIEVEKKDIRGAVAPAPAPTKPAKPKPAPKPRQPDPLFDALAEATGSDPVVTGSHIGKLAALLRKADPPYTPDEVREFARRYRELCGYAPSLDRTRPSLGEIEKNIGLLRAAKPRLHVPARDDAPSLEAARRLTDDSSGGVHPLLKRKESTDEAEAV